jgi:hypothetical protein
MTSHRQGVTAEDLDLVEAGGPLCGGISRRGRAAALDETEGSCLGTYPGVGRDGSDGTQPAGILWARA